jgi:dienelactone hydrolase
MEFSREDVEFSSHGATLRGWLYHPEDAAPGPGVVMAHGFPAVCEMFLDLYAEAFAAAGFTTLVYDQRNHAYRDSQTPGQGRPEETPPQPRQRGRPSARLRRRTLPGAQHRRALLQQAQAVPRRRHPLGKRDFMYQATVDVASIRIWLRDPVS